LIQIERYANGYCAVEWRRLAYLPKILEQHIATERIARCDNRSVIAPGNQGIEEIPDVVGLAGVVSPWQSIAIVPTIAKM
jgi:hypothetical protein